MPITADWANATASTFTYQDTATTNKPSGLSTGDTLLFFFVWYDDASGAGTVSTSWTPTNTLTVVREATVEKISAYGWTRIVDGSEGATFGATPQAGAQYNGLICIPIKGASPTSPFDTANSTNGRSSSQSIAGLTTATADELLVGIKYGYGQAVTADPANWTPRGTYDTVIEVYDRSVASAGVVSSEALTAAGLDGFVSMVAAFKADVGSPAFPVHLLSAHTPFSTNHRGRR